MALDLSFVDGGRKRKKKCEDETDERKMGHTRPSDPASTRIATDRPSSYGGMDGEYVHAEECRTLRAVYK